MANNINQLVDGPPSTKPLVTSNQLIFCAIATGIILITALAYLKGEMVSGDVAGRITANIIFALLIVWYFCQKKVLTIYTAFILMLVLSSIFTIAGGLRDTRNDAKNKDAAIQLTNSTLSILENYAATMESVKDESTAKTALVQLNELYRQAQNNVLQSMQLPSITNRDMDEIKKRFEPRFVNLEARFKKAIESLEKHVQDSTPFEDAFEKMIKLFQSLANVDGNK